MADVTVLVIDMMNAYQHPDAELLIPNVAKIIEPLTDLIARVRERDDVDLVYLNDNYGDFTAEPSDIVRSALAGERPDCRRPPERLRGEVAVRGHGDRAIIVLRLVRGGRESGRQSRR